MLWLFLVIAILTLRLAATCQTSRLIRHLCFSSQTSFSRSRKRTWTSSCPPSLNPSQISQCRQRKAWRSRCPRANPTGPSRSRPWVPAPSQRVRQSPSASLLTTVSINDLRDPVWQNRCKEELKRFLVLSMWVPTCWGSTGLDESVCPPVAEPSAARHDASGFGTELQPKAFHWCQTGNQSLRGKGKKVMDGTFSWAKPWGTSHIHATAAEDLERATSEMAAFLSLVMSLSFWTLKFELKQLVNPVFCSPHLSFLFFSLPSPFLFFFCCSFLTSRRSIRLPACLQKRLVPLLHLVSLPSSSSPEPIYSFAPLFCSSSVGLFLFWKQKPSVG